MITERKVSEKLRSIGIPANLRGFAYIKTVVVLVSHDESYIYAITKRLYPDIARKHNTTAPRVERTIRHAVEYAFLEGNVNELGTLGAARYSDGKMTNSEFISALYENLKYAEG